MLTKIIRTVVLLILLNGFGVDLSAQCPDNLNLTTQAEVDNFIIAYPNCTSIPGDVIIEGLNINQLSSLSNIESVGGDFMLKNSPLITNLSGLNQLDSIFGDFDVINQDNLVHLNALSGLRFIGGGLNIASSASLNSITGLSNLNHIGEYLALDALTTIPSLEGLEQITTVSGFLWVRNCHALTHLEGLQSIESVGGDLVLIWNYDMADISGLRSLKTVGEDFNIGFEQQITSLIGLDSLSSIGGFFSLSANTALENIEALGNLQIILGNFSITGNTSLIHLNGLDRLDSLGGTLFIKGNTLLSDCAAFGICEVLPSIAGADIDNNAVGCNTIMEIEAKCNDKFGEVNGQLFRDFNCDGIMNDIDLALPYVLLQNTDNNIPFSFTNSLGMYQKLLLDNTSFNFSASDIPGYTAFPESHMLTTGPMAELFTAYDFGYCPDSLFHNILVFLSEYNPPRPGFTNSYQICVENVGTQTENVLFSFALDENLDPDLFTIMDADGGTISDLSANWMIDNLPPYQQKCFGVELYLDPAAPLGLIFSTTANTQITPITPETNMADNIDSLTQTIVGSYDPNDKTVDREVIFNPDLTGGEWLEYHIRFQNTGTFPATFIEVLDTLDQKLDIRFFDMIVASHDYELSFPSDGVLKWRFDNINLPDSTTNEPESHGFITYRIKIQEELDWVDPVLNRAGIYFDFNEVILTNYAQTSAMLTNTVDLKTEKEALLEVYPNPASDILQIVRKEVSIKKVNLLSVSGKVLKTIQLSSNPISIRIDDLPRGFYLLTYRGPYGKLISQKLVIN
ncbi:MAG: hypothetical protein ACI8P3_003039 [Saprospiraceae bacterium]|jgi:hypothetical protein